MIKFKDIQVFCVWCSSEDIDYQGHSPIFDGEFVKFKFICNICKKESIELFLIEFFKTEAKTD